LCIGFVAGALCYGAVGIVKERLRVDDALDVLAVHGVGGATGMLLTAVFGTVALGGLGHSELPMLGQLGVQAVGVAATLAWTAVVTFIVVKVVNALVGLRVEEEEEIEGLDIRTHGERGYLIR
jgi:Amt family ammonium transporter